MTIYSHSRLSTFENCPLKYKLKYIDKIKPDIEQSIEGFLGNVVHDTLEWIYKEANFNDKTFQLDEVIKYYAESWNQRFNPEIRIVKEDRNQEYYLNKGIKFLIAYFLKHAPFKDNTIATEKRIVINLDKEGKYKLQGYIDRIVHNQDLNIFEIHDYKTSENMKSQQELDQDRQLALYCIAIKELYNPEDIHLIWHFLDFDKKIISKRTDKQLEDLKTQVINLINQIESTTEFLPFENPLCKWCEFRSHCPLMKDKPL